jgi:pantoate--beta-alanine ligase
MSRTMRAIKTIKLMQHLITRLRKQGQTIGFVPTMGALHEGHLSLIRAARKACDTVVVSIFVNPVQFGPTEDYTAYPRDFKRDAAQCRHAGVDILFCPLVEEVYPSGFQTFVQVEKLSQGLCGPFRPGHFRGVATVVLKLFQIVRPHQAFFGQKDYQQSRIIQRMVQDLSLPIRIRILPTVREADGLAMSSRNAYLNREERKAATVLYRALKWGEELIRRGEHSSRGIQKKMAGLIRQEPLVRLDYLAIADLENFQEIQEISGPALIAIAGWIGKTRLIDNLRLDIESKKEDAPKTS